MIENFKLEISVVYTLLNESILFLKKIKNPTQNGIYCEDFFRVKCTYTIDCFYYLELNCFLGFGLFILLFTCLFFSLLSSVFLSLSETTFVLLQGNDKAAYILPSSDSTCKKNYWDNYCCCCCCTYRMIKDLKLCIRILNF